MPTPEEFAREIRRKHRDAFNLHEKVALLLQDTIVKGRTLPDLVSRATDMLFVQGFKAHQSIGELASLALVEDTATIVRRLLELAITAVYIATDSEESVRTGRAGKYLAYLWHTWPADLRALIPVEERQAWEALYTTYGSDFAPNRKRWGPDFAAMFNYAECPDTYEQDYQFLSSIAHGSPPALVHDYSAATVSVHSDRFVPSLLNYGAR